MPKETQISAIISETTRERLEKHVRATGVKKGHLVEQALLHHLQALDELPADVIVHPRLVVTRKSFEKVIEQMCRRSTVGFAGRREDPSETRAR